MRTFFPSIVDHARARSRHHVLRDVRRLTTVSAALLAMVLSGACNSDAPTGAQQSRIPDPGLLDSISPFAGNDAGVRASAAAWDAAWNSGDAVALAALFVDDAEFINGRGQLALGAEAIGAQHAALLAGPFQGSRTQGVVRQITFLSGTTAVMDVDNQLTGFRSLPPGTVPTEPGIQRGRHKRVVMKRGGEWRIVLMQITTVVPGPAGM
jgi:uncharacterized protein (TIGR02246 family)